MKVKSEAFRALQTALLQAPTLSLPTGSELLLKKRLWQHCIRAVVTILLMPKARKFTNGQNFTILTSHDVVQSDNGSIFKAAVTQGVSKALEVEYHTVPGDSNLEKKFEKANDIIKRHPCKLSQETQDSWLKVLPMALMRA